MRLAAIDIGSNAMRMLFEEVYETPNGPVFKKLSLIRLPVRLGEDAFLTGKISPKKEEHVVSMAYSFMHLCSIFEVDRYLATATSAMRDSENGMSIIDRIQKEVGVKIQIIPGDEEAKLLYESIFNTGKIKADESYMFIDVGGGSTEINFYVNGERKEWKSFNLGAVRLKEGVVSDDVYDEFKTWIREKSAIYQPSYSVGTGGNINKLYKLCSLKDWEMLERKDLKAKLLALEEISHEEMVNEYDIKPDRADVIIPGGYVYLRAMKEAGIKEMIVPKVGLPDGLIRRLYFASQEGK